VTNLIQLERGCQAPLTRRTSRLKTNLILEGALTTSFVIDRVREG
jgi:hypothetical protein